MVQSTLDDFVLVSRSTSQDARTAKAVDLRDLALQDISAIRKCPSLQLGLLSGNALTAIHPMLLSLRRLQKIDLSSNGLTMLPSEPEDWAGLASLKILYLHSNQLASLRMVAALGSLPTLLRLTLFDNALAQHPNYRHFVVNSILTLRALDRHVISDEVRTRAAPHLAASPRERPCSPPPLCRLAFATSGAHRGRRVYGAVRRAVQARKGEATRASRMRCSRHRGFLLPRHARPSRAPSLPALSLIAPSPSPGSPL